ncbi:hypothetical protein P167DRAFT_579863 [Morchella conica CCBAS932]|uniref:Uncharacterized protein n=1 Tax=Morchella conica CCBAS932 TaxID=1392247 RepID=A0A3N4KM76_9PEZI|nr:hypothetical protein P167DRAFT_579863 [Morchella conica CCBAS932]
MASYKYPSNYYNAPENDYESFQEYEDKLYDEPQALALMLDAEFSDCLKETSYNSRTARALDNPQRKPNAVVAEIRNKRGVTIEVLPEEDFNGDNEALVADCAKFQMLREQARVLQEGGIDTEEEGEE